MQLQESLQTAKDKWMYATSKEPPGAGHLLWYCLRTQPKREHIAAALLKSQCGLEVFCPRISQVKRTKTGKRRYIEAMFPGYIFARFRLDEQYRRIVHTSGVRGLVHRGDSQIIPVAETVIHELRASMPDEAIIETPDPSLDPGTRVEFISGSLSGLSGQVIARLPADDRVKVLMEFLGRELTVTVSPQEIHMARDN